MRIFQINEYGDIHYDDKNRTISNIILDSKLESDFATCRTIIITHFKYNEVLKNDFIKNKRNTITDEEIVDFFEFQLDKAFENYPTLRNFVKYEYINEGKSFDVLFYFQNTLTKKHLVFHTITI